jgi:hypothetical protein
MSSARLLARDLAHVRRRYRAALLSGRKRLSPRRVHDLRANARHLQACLTLTGAVLGNAAGAKALRNVTRLLHRLGPLRDAQVQLKRLRARVPRPPGLAPLRAHLQRRARRLAAATAKRLKAGRLVRRLRALERRLKSWPRNAASERQTRLRLGRALASARCPPPPSWGKLPAENEGLHRVRRALKRNYLMGRILRSFSLGPGRSELVGMAEKLSVLGEIHDSDVLMARVRSSTRDRVLSSRPAEALRRQLERRRNQLLAEAQKTPSESS